MSEWFSLGAKKKGVERPPIDVSTQLLKGMTFEKTLEEEKEDEDIDEISELIKNEETNFLKEARKCPIADSFGEIIQNMVKIDESVYKKVLKPGFDDEIGAHAIVRAHYDMFLEFAAVPFDSTTWRGKPALICLENVMPGLQIAIASMKVKEEARFVIKWDKAFGLCGRKDIVPPESDILVDLEVLTVVDTLKSTNGISCNDYFKLVKTEYLDAKEESSHPIAIKQLTDAYDLLNSKAVPSTDEDKNIFTDLKEKICLSIATRYNSMNKSKLASKWCGEALQVNVKSPDVYYLFASTKGQENDLDSALKYIKIGLSLAPKDNRFTTLLKDLSCKKKKNEDFEKMFAKKAFGFKEKKRERSKYEIDLVASIEKHFTMSDIPFRLGGYYTAKEKKVFTTLAGEENWCVTFKEGFVEFQLKK